MTTAWINNHRMYFEVHGDGPPVICAGGWGTYCHGNEGMLPRGLTDRYSVVIFDHRGLAESGDDAAVAASTALHAGDVIGLARHLGIEQAHLVGIIGIGACIFQEVAIRQPDLVRSMVNTGCWARPDAFFADQLQTWLQVHRQLGFTAFQNLVVREAFDPIFFNENRHRLLGPAGGWAELRGNIAAHARLTEAGLAHDSLDRLARIAAPVLVMHNGRDLITGPRLTLPVERGIPGAEGHMMGDAAHVVTGREGRKEFCDTLLDFLARH